MKDRISKILREEGMTAAKFADEIGVQASSISHIISGRNKPSTDFLIKLLERFRGINAEWLLTGKGEMYKSGNSTENRADSFNYRPENTLFDDLGEENKSILDENNVNEADLEHSSTENFENLNNASNFKSEGTTNTQKSNDDKTVEKIVIFFSDKTFESYTPPK